MVGFKKGNIFKEEADVLVCPVNCVGVMGAGLAKDFKVGFPGFYQEYHRVCSRKELKPGGIILWNYIGRPEKSPVKAIIAAATKDHWRSPSMLGWVEQCLKEMRKVLGELSPFYRSLALPLLGAGLGALPVADVQMVTATTLFPLTQGPGAMRVTAVDPQVVSEREGKTA